MPTSAITGTFTAAGRSAIFDPSTGRDFNITISGGSATIRVERSFDQGATWFTVVTDDLRRSLPESFTLSEGEADVIYSLNCTAFSSGPVTYRISQ